MLNSLETAKPQQLAIQDGDIWGKTILMTKSIPPEDLNRNQSEIQTKLDNLESSNPLDHPITQT